MPLISTKAAASAQGFGEFASSAAPVYIEDVFSTYLYTGNGSTQTITNGIDLSTKGGLVWCKGRSVAAHGILFDTARGITKYLLSSLANAEATNASGDRLTAFNSNGFSLGTDPGSAINASGDTYASWTFREQAKFFDVVTYTGNGSNRTISHNLGSVPGCIIVKRTDTTGDWQAYHRSLANTEYMVLNTNAAKATGTTRWNSTTPTSTEFSLGTDATVNASGGTYVAYLFAHDAGGFGLSGTDNVISCGSYTGNGSDTGPVVTLGYEPQWILIKNATDGATNWTLIDNMRGLPVGSAAARLHPNLSDAEYNNITVSSPLPTGFQITNTNSFCNTNGSTYIYIAIRRGPMKVPTTGTSVYNGIERTGNGTTTNLTGVGFAPDVVLYDRRGGLSAVPRINDKLRGAAAYLDTSATSAEVTASQTISGFLNDGVILGNGTLSSYPNNSGESYINWFFRRAPGFFDVVCYTGTGSTRTINHNLGVVPELIIVKGRSQAGTYWSVRNSSLASGSVLYLNIDYASTENSTLFTTTAPTQSVFSVGTNDSSNASGQTLVAYLFATVAGVSKVGSYTGSGTTKQIDCGFTAGARFVLIKRTDSTGDWYVWDSARGIVASTDPYLVLNSTAAEVTTTDWVDTYSAGFELSSAAGNNVNINTASYIFLSIA